MRPRAAASGRKILSVSAWTDVDLTLLRLLNLRVDAIQLGVFDSFFFGRKFQTNLRLGV